VSKYDIDKFEKDYNKFARPKCIIKIEGTQIDDKYIQETVEVNLSCGYEASSCSFTLSNAFKRGENYAINIEDDLKKIIKLGNKIEIFMGYEGGKTKQVFFGYIDSVYLDYNWREGIYYSVEGLDAKGIMMSSYRSEVKKDIKKYSDAVTNTLKNYSKLIKKKTIEPTGEISTIIEQHNESDYNFVVRLAKKNNYSFYILNGEAFFQKIGKDTEEFFKFNIEEYIESFTMFSTLKNQVSSVTVRSNNEKNPDKPFEATVSAYKNIVDGSKVEAGGAAVINSKITKSIIDNSISSESEAKARAEAELNSISYSNSKGKITIVGIPDFIPDKVVTVEGFGDGYNKKYRIVKVIHKLNENRYTTECELEVNKL